MLGRFVCGLGASVLFAAACGGGAFSSATDEGSGGSASGSGATGSGGKSSGGNKAQGGSVGQGGKAGANTGGSTVAGMTSTGGNPGGGVASVSGNAGTMTGESGAPVVEGPECFEPSDCDVSNSCHEATCDEGVCDEVHVPDGPFHLQVPGDCKRMDCVDGEEMLVVDVNDKDDGNECTTDSCSPNGVPMHKARFAAECNGGAGTCNADGNCQLCNRELCPPSTACSAAICGNGSCQLAPRPVGELCPHQSPLDMNDTYGQCDGFGLCVDCVTSGGCGECCVCDQNRTCQPG